MSKKDMGMDLNCKHTDWEAAGHPTRNGDLRTTTMYKVWCRGCNNFVHLLSGDLCNDEGLVKISDMSFYKEGLC